MGNRWRVRATLSQSADGLRLGLSAMHDGASRTETTSDSMMVSDEADARREARAFCQRLETEVLDWEDRRAAA